MKDSEITDKINKESSVLTGIDTNKAFQPSKTDTGIPVFFVEDEKYGKLRQSPATNTLSKMSIVKTNAKVDPIVDKAVQTRDGLTVTLENFSSLTGGLKTSTQKLFDAIIAVFTQGGSDNPTVHISLNHYMALCALRDKKEARLRVKEDLNTLYSISISFREAGSGNFLDFRLFEAIGFSRGIIMASMSQAFFSHIRSYSYMPYPRQLWALNAQNNPNSYYFLRKISEHKHMNRKKPNENIISVKTLLDASPVMPDYEEVAKSRQTLQRIVRPFIRDMNALNETLLWYILNENGDNLNNEEVEKIPYLELTEKSVHISWIRYPEKLMESWKNIE